LEEDFRQPLHFCPIDLRKLETITKCDIVERYKSLKVWYEENGLDEEGQWTSKVLQRIGDVGTDSKKRKRK
jgi:archaemetzincin